MRLHHLSVTAFGPFAGSVEVDLDEVAAGGLFLIRGATGAGKTSLLDAIAFALYADVPGSRSKKTLHSDHADRGSVPQVTLEFTAVGRRFRIERSPEFLRPKARGTGETKVQAKAILWEQRESGWEAISTRHDEIAEVVKDVLGMGLEQFTKVVLLPQGDFAAFLRATPEERRGLLEKLFDVSTYAGVEEWFATQRKEAAAAVEAQHAALRSDLAVLADVLADAPTGLVETALAGVDLEAEPDATSPAEPEAGPTDWSALPLDQLPDALTAICDALERASVQAMATVDTTRSADSLAARGLHGAREVAARRERGRQATEALQALASGQEEHDDAVATLEAAARARSVSGDLAALSRAEDGLELARERHAATAVEVAGLGATPDTLEDVVDRVAAATAELDDAARYARTWRERAGQHVALLERCRQVEEARAELEARIAGRRDVAVAAQRQLAETTQAAGAIDAAAGHVRDLVNLHRIRVALDRGLRDLVAAGAVVDARRTAAQDLRDTYQDLRQTRLDGMAAELAARLADDQPCPVCGSPDHPVPAVDATPVSAEDVDRAERTWQAAAGQLSEAQAVVASLEAAQAERLAQLGGEQRDADSLADAVARAQADHTVLVERAAALDRARAQVAAAETEIATLTEQAAELRDSLTAARTTLAALEGDLEGDMNAVHEAVERHRASCPCEGASSIGPAEVGALLDSLPALRSRHDTAVQALVEHAGATRALETAGTTLATVLGATGTALTGAGFGDAASARAALVSPSDTAALQARTTAHDTALIQARTILEDPEVAAALAGPVPDLEALSRAADLARHAYAEALGADTLVRRTLAGVERVRSSVAERGVALTAAAARHDVLREVADAVAGTSSSNSLRMRLSAFVLAARLEKVAALANERLSTMGDGRYQLRHTDGLAARGARSGLGLEVLDLWTGQARDTSSLSGGESFMASLALALGLADGVREESGGFDLQTLFVDEGFGTLDDESLEQVMAVLDDLREGGRAVGVVSHVAELRTRISSQVVVVKTERGSTVRTAVVSDAAPAA
ncbi:SMC family ATPase [Pedococcus sp. KACC 23699]|uniref:Nuclease SbcCD subunit C n=1 Tax=Pedococcus sp. KACC 23699 TaxID=3149228 RepID=A0AAU7JT07_9MICO